MRALFVAAAVSLSAAAVTAQSSCSANLASQLAHASSGRNTLILETYINDSGPYAFMLDTGSQVTMIDETLASELKLKPTSDASVVGVSLEGKAGKYALVNSVRVGEGAKVGSTYVLAFNMKQMQDAGFAVRGLIGEDFLSHFDATIDHSHNRVCFTYATGSVASVSAPENQQKIVSPAKPKP